MNRWLAAVFVILLVVNVSLAAYYFYLRPTSQRQAEEMKKTSFFCPVPKEYCSLGRRIELEGEYLGVGYLVPSGTPILAVLPGQVKGSGVLV